VADWGGGIMVCLLAAMQIKLFCSLTWAIQLTATHDCTICCSIISSCQPVVSSKTVKCFLSQVWLKAPVQSWVPGPLPLHSADRVQLQTILNKIIHTSRHANNKGKRQAASW